MNEMSTKNEFELAPIVIKDVLVGSKQGNAVNNQCEHESSYNSDHSYYFAVDDKMKSIS